ncbi:MAG: hypothetical protein GY940_18870, partial [bacterium]|nr:hypothetical protein [bacterium]
RYKVGAIIFEGNGFISTERLKKIPGFKSDEIFSPEKYKTAAPAIRSLYLREGFSKATVSADVKPDMLHQELDIYFTIRENQRGFIRDIIIIGSRKTKPDIIHRALAFKKGDTLYTHTINKTRKNLYDLGIFDQVDIVPVPVYSISDPENGQFRNYRVEVRVKEQDPFRLKYGFQLKTTAEEDSPLSIAGTTQLSHYNLF